MAELLNVDDALTQILAFFQRLPAETVAIDAALGRVLAEDIRADINLPPFPNSSMDGFAVRAADVDAASSGSPVTLRVAFDIPAGQSPERPLGAGEAARIMTGAPMPDGADAVVPVEQTDTTWQVGETTLPEQVSIFSASQTGAYVRPVGEDVQSGSLVLTAGTVLRPQEIGVLVALGRAHINVIRPPRVAIISTGDELVGADEPLTPGKIRDVNSYTLAGLVGSYGGVPTRIPVARDTLDDVRRCFNEALAAQPDIVLSSAGVSVGAFDVVRTVLAELGEISFWRVNLRPGKPLAFGLLGQVPFFGLPGNPVSAMVTFDVFVRPALLKLSGHRDDETTVQAVTGEDLTSDGRRSYLRVRLEREGGQLVAYTTGTQSSGALLSMVLADGLLIVPEGLTEIAAGTTLPVRLLKPGV